MLVNLLQLIPSVAVVTVLSEVAQALAPGGTICLYGPFLRGGQPSSHGDAAFDASLRAQDPEIGYKDLDWVLGVLARQRLVTRIVDMPANNLMLLSKHAATSD